jgi:hypothetical protein
MATERTEPTPAQPTSLTNPVSVPLSPAQKRQQKQLVTNMNARAARLETNSSIVKAANLDKLKQVHGAPVNQNNAPDDKPAR